MERNTLSGWSCQQRDRQPKCREAWACPDAARVLVDACGGKRRAQNKVIVLYGGAEGVAEKAPGSAECGREGRGKRKPCFCTSDQGQTEEALSKECVCLCVCVRLYA